MWKLSKFFDRRSADERRGLGNKDYGSGDDGRHPGDDPEAILREGMNTILKMIDDEEYQIELMNPDRREYVRSSPAYDKKPNGVGPFGFVETNPVPVNGPIGEVSYLSRLEAGPGRRLLFHRLGSIEMTDFFNADTYVDVFEAVTFDGGMWCILYLDMYHSKRSRLAPEGLRFTQDFAQFSGYTHFCNDFPYDFMEQKSRQHPPGLSMAYIPVSKVYDNIQRRAYDRPPAHIAKLRYAQKQLSHRLG